MQTLSVWQKQYKILLILHPKKPKKVLKVSDCHLAHMRLEGKLPFVKKGNAYMYETDFVDKMKGEVHLKIPNLM